MPDNFSPQEQAAIPVVLSQPRFNTYLVEKNNNTLDALKLYHWNAQISASFLFPLHVFEICIRNAASNAIESAYNPNWPWANAFEMSLPDHPPPLFSPRREIRAVRARQPTTGKVIADIRFAFWQSLYTRRHNGRLWTPYFRREYPNIPPAMSVGNGRRRIFGICENTRELRNRIAHHEPIFRRNLQTDYDGILEAIRYRCGHTAAWVERAQTVRAILALRP